MSANNKLIIEKKGDGWHIENVDVDCGKGFEVGYRTQTLEEAVAAAEEYMEENEVEYGYRIILPK